MTLWTLASEHKTNNDRFRNYSGYERRLMKQQRIVMDQE
jgi:hypothetical protein